METKQRKLLNNEVFFYFCSFLLATVMMIIVLASNGIYPGSTRTLFISDMKAQYVSFLASLRYLGHGDNNLFFNWSHTLGGNYLGLFAYYLASPLSWLTLLFDLEHMPEAVYLLTVLKIGLAGLTFSVFLNRGIAKKPGNPVILLFASCYALMSFNVLYALCIMWLDAIILFPLILLGVERLIQGKKGGLYLISITFCFLTNYYLSYMVGIFTVIYLIYRLVCHFSREQWEAALRVAGRFTVNTLLGIGLAMPLLLPVVLDLSAGRGKVEQNPHTFTVYYSFWKVFTKLFSSQYDTINNVGALPSLFCGTVMVFLTLLFFLQKKQPLKDRLGTLIIMIFLLVSFWYVPLDKAWHGFRFPSWFPFRYAFTFSTMMLLASFRALEELDIEKVKTGKLIYRVACGFTLLELFLNGSNIIGGLDLEAYYSLRYDYEDFLIPTEKLVASMKEMDDGLYRADKDYQYGLNDSMLLDYNSLTHSSSTFHYNAAQFTRRLGLAQVDWWNMNYGSTLLTDSLFAVKYRFAEKMMPEGWISHNKEMWYTLYENPYALPIAYTVSDTCTNASPEWDRNPFVNQEALLELLSDEKANCFEPVSSEAEYTDEAVTITFTALADTPYYLYIDGNEIRLSDEEQFSFRAWLDTLDLAEQVKVLNDRKSELTVNESRYGDYFEAEKKCITYLGTFEDGEKVEIKLDHHGLASVDAYYLVSMNQENLTNILTQMSKKGMTVTDHGNGHFSGTVTASKGEALFTTIPYDAGYTVKIDGTNTEYTTFDDTFLMVPLTEGTHEIEISYRSPGVTMGMVLALIALALTAGYYILKR